MPEYDFKCDDCRRNVVLSYKSLTAYAEAEVHRCPRCGGENVRRRIGRVALGRSDDDRLAGVADEAMLNQIDENDPRSLGRFMKTMSREMGEDIGDDFNEVVERLESGQPPEQIEKEMPGLAEEDSAGFQAD